MVRPFHCLLFLLQIGFVCRYALMAMDPGREKLFSNGHKRWEFLFVFFLIVDGVYIIRITRGHVS